MARPTPNSRENSANAFRSMPIIRIDWACRSSHRPVTPLRQEPLEDRDAEHGDDVDRHDPEQGNAAHDVDRGNAIGGGDRTGFGGRVWLELGLWRPHHRHSFLAPTYGLCATQYSTRYSSPLSAICGFRHGRQSHNLGYPQNARVVIGTLHEEPSSLYARAGPLHGPPPARMSPQSRAPDCTRW